MLKSLLSVFSLLALIFSVFTVNIINAGGGGIYVNTTKTEDPHWSVVRAYFDPSLFTCKGITVNFNFDNSIEGDKVSGVNGDNSSTITEDATYDTINGKQYKRCSTYAKVYSSKLELNRTFTISFKGPNLEGSRSISFSPGAKSYGETLVLLPWEGSLNPIIIDPNSTKCYPGPCETKTIKQQEKISAWILNDQLVDSKNNRQITVKWGAFDGNPGTFSIYASQNKNGWEKLAEGERGPSATIILKSDHDYHIQVRGCQDKVGTCGDSNILTLPKLSPLKQRSTDNIEPFRTPNSTVSPTPNTDNQKVDELNKKVENLQNQLQESQKNQSALETRINDLVSFIKRIFPFFK